MASERVWRKETGPRVAGHPGCVKLQLQRDEVIGCGGDGDSDGVGGGGGHRCVGVRGEWLV